MYQVNLESILKDIKGYSIENFIKAFLTIPFYENISFDSNRCTKRCDKNV